MKRTRVAFALFLALVMSISLFGCGQKTSDPSTKNPDGGNNSNPTYTLRVALTVGVDNPRYGASAKFLSQRLKKRPMVPLRLSYIRAVSFGTDTETTEAVMLGNLEMVAPSSSIWVPFDDRFAVLDLPYLFTSLDSAHAALQGGEVGKTLNEWAEALNVHVLSWGDSGFRGLTNNRGPVYSPDDLKGLKLRCMENSYHLAAF